MAVHANITRRGALKALPAAGIAAIVAAPSTAESLPHPDEALLLLDAALSLRWACWDAIAAKAEIAGHPPELDDEYESAYQACSLTVRSIENTKARTLDGLKVKARAIEWCHCGDHDFDFGEATDSRLASDIVKTLLTI